MPNLAKYKGSGLHVRNPLYHIVGLATHANASAMLDCVKVGNYVYGVTGNAGAGANYIITVDVSNPYAPSVVHTLNVATNFANPRRIDASATHLFVTVRDSNRLAIFSISTPSAPTLVTNFTHANLNGPYGLAYNGSNHVIVGTTGATSRITSINISNPAVPTMASSITDATAISAVLAVHRVTNTVFCASSGTDRLAIVSISNPAALSLTSSITHANLNNCAGVVRVGSICYVTSQDEDKVAAIQTTTLASPSYLGASAAQPLDANNPLVIKSAHGKLFTTCSLSRSLSVWNIANTSTPVLDASLAHTTKLGNVPSGLAIDGDFAYVTATNGNLVVIKVN